MLPRPDVCRPPLVGFVAAVYGDAGTPLVFPGCGCGMGLTKQGRLPAACGLVFSWCSATLMSASGVCELRVRL